MENKTLYSPDLIADAAINLLSGNEQASDFRSGSWKSFNSKDEKTPLPSCKAVIVSDGNYLTIHPAAGIQTVTTWKSGITGIVRIIGSFEALTGSADVVLKPPSGVEVIGCSCAEDVSVFTSIENNWMGLGTAWKIEGNSVPAVVKADKEGSGLLAGDLGGHTPNSAFGSNKDYSWFKWIAPTGMTIDISGGVWSNFYNDRTCNFSIRKNSDSIFGGFRDEGTEMVSVESRVRGQERMIGSHVIPKTASSQNPDSFNICSVKVKAGDKITFNFNSNGTLDYANSGTFFGICVVIKNATNGEQWNLAEGWSTKNNPDSVWTYGQTVFTAVNNKIPFDFIRRVAIGDEYKFLVGKSDNTGAAEVKVLLKATVAEVKKLKVNGRMFPANLPEAVWETFKAEGYTKPVTGIIYRNTPHPPSGVPMGGIDTGGLDIDTAGTLGYTSVFNHTTPVGGPLNTPFIGLSVGEQTWVLTTCKTKSYWNSGPSMPSPDIMLQNVMIPEYIDYWGHYPIVNMEYKMKSPVLASLRAWSPFLPGDAKTSNTPGAIFEIKLTNQTKIDQAGTLAFSFPGFAKHETKNLAIGIGSNRSKNPVLPAPEISREHIEGKLTGVNVNNKSWNMSYTLAALDEKQVQTGGELGIDGNKWALIHNMLPEVKNDDGGSSLAVDFKLEPNEKKVIKLILAWFAPEWEGNGAPGTGGERIKYLGGDRTSGKSFTHMYATRFKTSREVAEYLAKENKSLLKRIIAWQSTIYNYKNIPGWLADSLINNLYYFADTSFWAQAKPPIGEWCRPEDGIFALGESPRSCFNMNTIPNLAIAGPLVSYLFPELELTNLRAIKAYQLSNGDIPSIFGNYSDVATPLEYGEYQVVMNGANYMEILDRYWRVTEDDDFLKEFYDSAKKAIEFTFSLRPEYGLSQIVAMPAPVPGKANWREWFEDREWKGYVVHPGGYRMAAARMMRIWSDKMGDKECTERLDKWLHAGEKALQEHLWTGDHYMAMNEPETGEKLDCIFMPQLNGQLYARLHGLPGVFPKQNVQRTLDLFEQACKLSHLGMPPIYMKPDGSVWDVDFTGYLTSRYIYLNMHVIDIALTFMYEGRRDFGLELLRKNLEIYSCKWGYTWDGAAGGSALGDTGEKSIGWDYWMNWILWGSLAALEEQDLSSPCRPGGLINRIIKAAKAK